MDDLLGIRDTGISIVRVLDLIAQGRSYDSILNRHPELNFFDIGRAAARARDIIVCLRAGRLYGNSGSSEDNVRIRGWTDGENRELRKLYRCGATIGEMARIFLRSESEVRNHLGELRMLR